VNKVRDLQKKEGIRGIGLYGVWERRFSSNIDSLYPCSSGGNDRVQRL